MDRERLDARDSMPADIRAYLEKNGWSFSKKMCEFAVSRMKDRDGKKIEPITKEQIDKLLKTNGIELKHDNPSFYQYSISPQRRYMITYQPHFLIHECHAQGVLHMLGSPESVLLWLGQLVSHLEYLFPSVSHKYLSQRSVLPFL